MNKRRNKWVPRAHVLFTVAWKFICVCNLLILCCFNTKHIISSYTCSFHPNWGLDHQWLLLFFFGGKCQQSWKLVYYQQIHGATMGSPLSPIVCNLYMNDFEQRAIESASHPTLWWFRYVDDTHWKLKRQHTQEFVTHMNSIDQDIQFTTECETNGTLAFPDTNTIRQEDGSLKAPVTPSCDVVRSCLGFYQC